MRWVIEMVSPFTSSSSSSQTQLTQTPLTQTPLTQTPLTQPVSVYIINHALVSALVAFALAQLIKLFTTWYREKRWDLKRLVGSGGMPSSHSATVTALAVAVGFQDGIGTSTFAAVLIFACIVMYDATGVRLQAGRQAEVLNQIIYQLPAEHPLAESMPLRQLLGHTPSQVIVGGLLGMMTATIIHLILHPAGLLATLDLCLSICDVCTPCS